MESSRQYRSVGFRMEAFRAFLVFGTSGLIGVLVDIDHFISLLLWRYISSNVNEGRLFHTSLFIITGMAICYMGARLRGLHFKLVLVGVLLTTVLILIYSPYVVWSWKK